MKKRILIALVLVATVFCLSGYTAVKSSSRSKHLSKHLSKHFSWWGKSGAGPGPVKDFQRGGKWWWPNSAPSGKENTQWGNRGVVYLNEQALATPTARHVNKQMKKVMKKNVQKPVIHEKVVRKKAGIGLNDVYFNCNSSTLTASAQTVIKNNVQVLKDNPSMKVILEGYASPEGKQESNMTLSQQRAEAVQKQLVAEGISADRIKVIAKGVLQMQKESWPDARKAHFKVE
jgi:outer membrane protein OmpA-like peptidoglycan-associated protein